uniref:Uncharacterized protein n=2 Tax=Onchocerca ochengi TaxID=42157 RepID=A0A182EL19_ONCOC
MLRNINQPKLCNCTQLAVKKINEQPPRSSNPDRTKTEDAWLRARSCSAASDLLCFEQNKRYRLRVTERHQQEADQCQTRFRIHQLRDYNHFAL